MAGYDKLAVHYEAAVADEAAFLVAAVNPWL